MNIYYLHFFLVAHCIFCNCKNSKCCKYNRHNINKAENDEDDKNDNNEFKKKYDNKKNNIVEKKAFSRWFRDNCGIQVLIISIIYLFKDNTELLNKFKNSNIDFYKKIPIIIERFNDFLNNNEKTLSDQDFVDFYIDILIFFKIKINDSTNNINKYIKNHPKIIDEKGEENDNAYDDENFQNLYKIRQEYSEILDDLIIIKENKEIFNVLIEKYKLHNERFIFNCILTYLKSYFENKDCWFKYNDIINDFFQIIEKNKLKLELYTKLYYEDFLRIVFKDFIKINKINNKIYKYNIEDKITTIEFINDENDENLTNNDFKKSQLLNSNFENVYFISLNCSLGGKEFNHVSCIYKDNNGDWWLNGGFSKIIKVDPELIKQQNFKQIMDNYSYIMNYKFVGIKYVLCKNIN